MKLLDLGVNLEQEFRRLHAGTGQRTYRLARDLANIVRGRDGFGGVSR
jgi:hypothetical protein